MLKIFISAPYPLKSVAEGFSRFIKTFDFEVVSTWHNIQPHKDLQKAATIDLQDLDRANTFIILKDENLGNGGKDVEYGYAIAKEYNLCVVSYVGPLCIYDYLKQVTVVPYQVSVVQWLEGLNGFKDGCHIF